MKFLPLLVHQNLPGLHHQCIFHPVAYPSTTLVQRNCFVILNWFSAKKKLEKKISMIFQHTKEVISVTGRIHPPSFELRNGRKTGVGI